MKPVLDMVVSALKGNIGKKLAATPPGPERFALGCMKTVLTMVERELDRAAAMRFEEIGVLSRLLTDASSICPAELSAQFTKAVREAAVSAKDIRVSALERTLDMLKLELIELHAWLETTSDPRTAVFLTRCWDFLLQANAKRSHASKPW